MAKNKVSEWSPTASNNTDISGINIAEGCAPSGINNAIRELMAQVKDMQAGTDGDNFVVGGGFTCSGAAVFSSTVALGAAATATTQSAGDNSTKVATTAYVATAVSGGVPSGCIVIWSGASNAIPSGWYLCDGANNTPNLRDRFVVGAGSTYAVGATGGSADAILLSHEHSINDPGHFHTVGIQTKTLDQNAGSASLAGAGTTNTSSKTTGITVGSVTNASGTVTSTATGANLPPYYALCYIMKA